MSTAIDQSYIEETQGAVVPLEQEVAEAKVNDNDQFVLAGSLLNDRIKPMIKEIHTKLDPICVATNEAHKTATTTRKDLLAPFVAMESHVKGLMGDFILLQEELQKEERERIEREARAREASEQAEADKAAQEEQLAAATALEEGGDQAAAERVLNAEPAVRAPEPLPAPPPAPELQKPKAGGISTSKKYQYEVTDFQALVRDVVEGNVPWNVLTIDKANTNQHIRANDGAVAWKGIRVFAKAQIRGKR